MKAQPQQVRGSRTAARSIAVTVALLCAAPAAAEEQVIDGIAAQVGSEIVLISEVDQISAQLEARMREAGLSETEITLMRAEGLERLIEAKILDRVVERTEMGATEGEIDAAIMGIAKENGLTLQQLADGVAAHGIPFPTYRKQIKHEIDRSKILNTMVRSRIHVEPNDVQDLFAARYGDQPVGGEQIHLRHILVPAGVEVMSSLDATCPELEAERVKIVSQQVTFADAARKMAALKQESGGDLGWLHADDVAAWMKPAIDGLDNGDISQVVQTNFGCNLMMVVARRGFTPVRFDQAAPELYKEIFDQKTEEEYVRWIDKLRDQTYIQRKGVYAEVDRLLRQQAVGR
jgi:peptidyl-prolyl cis-trans isomerase SurA